MTTPTHGARGAVRRSERALAPDLARGGLLLFIALANAANCAFASQPGIDPTPDGVERVLNFLLVTLVDSRAYPVFAVMFGYGLVQITRRQRAAGGDERPVLLRRNAWLIVFGLAHATLLYFGDFLGAYGIVGILATCLLVRRSDRFHRLVLWIWGILLVYVGVLAVGFASSVSSGHARLSNTTNDSLAAGSYARSLVDRLQEWPAHTATVIPIIVIVWLGIWAARHRVLENPGEHRRLLVWTAVGGLGISILGALPYALLSAGAIDVDSSTVDAMARLHAVSGEYGGPGYVALFALLAIRLGSTERQGPGTRAVVALGQRSLSGYLFQSVAWIAIFSPWAFDRGGDSMVAVAAALGVWAISVVVAHRMDALGYRGPAETALRRLTYGRAA